MSITEWVTRSVLNIPPDFRVKQKWSSSSHFHFLVLVPLAPVIPFVKCNKETHMLPSKQSPPFILQIDMDRRVDGCGQQMKMERDKWEGRWEWPEDGWLHGWVDGQAGGGMRGHMDKRGEGTQADVPGKMLSRHTQTQKKRQRHKSVTKKIKTEIPAQFPLLVYCSLNLHFKISKGLSSSSCHHIPKCGNCSIIYVPSNRKMNPLGKTNLPHPPNKRI